jgi:catechol 2,3-dioxygenase-like lactoylglutathione lyase family enzyme
MLSERRAHTTLPTPDPERLRRFYEDVLGFTPFEERPAAVLYRAGEGTQLAFTVPDVEAEVAELRARGVVFEEYEAPKTEHGIARLPAGRAAWFHDPDGNLLGIVEFDA